MYIFVKITPSSFSTPTGLQCLIHYAVSMVTRNVVAINKLTFVGTPEPTTRLPRTYTASCFVHSSHKLLPFMRQLPPLQHSALSLHRSFSTHICSPQVHWIDSRYLPQTILEYSSFPVYVPQSSTSRRIPLKLTN